MNQGHRRHGGGSYTLLYYIGLEGKEDRRTEERRQKDKRTKTGEKGKEDRRTKEQKQVEKETGARGKKNRRQKNKRTKTGGKGNRSKGEKGQKATTEAAQSGDWKVVAYLESVANSYGWRVKPNARYAFRAHGLAMT